MIPIQYRPALKEMLVDLRNELGGDRERTASFLIRNVARFIGAGTAETVVRQVLMELQGLDVTPDLAIPVTTSDLAGTTGMHGDVVDPAGYTEASVSATSHFEECGIEPNTGLLIRYAVWRPSVRNWWMLSSLGIGHVKLVGSKSDGMLVAENFIKNGQQIEVLGFTDYELHGNETPDTIRYLNKGNETHYNHTRRYVVVQCRSLS
jgi:hypothetical protein